MTLEHAAQVATVIGALSAVVGLFYAGVQLRKNARIAEGQFLIELTKMFAEHEEVHVQLRPAGSWRNGKANPNTPEEWVAIDNYMGLFERCEILIRQKTLDPSVFAGLFGYRLDNILSQPAIVGKKLVGGESMYWADFISLLDRMQKMEALNSEWPIAKN